MGASTTSIHCVSPLGLSNPSPESVQWSWGVISNSGQMRGGGETQSEHDRLHKGKNPSFRSFVRKSIGKDLPLVREGNLGLSPTMATFLGLSATRRAARKSQRTAKARTLQANHKPTFPGKRRSAQGRRGRPEIITRYIEQKQM